MNRQVWSGGLCWLQGGTYTGDLGHSGKSKRKSKGRGAMFLSFFFFKCPCTQGKPPYHDNQCHESNKPGFKLTKGFFCCCVLCWGCGPNCVFR